MTTHEHLAVIQERKRLKREGAVAERARIRAALLDVCRTKARRYDHAAGYDHAVTVEDLCASLDRLIPEAD